MSGATVNLLAPSTSLRAILALGLLASSAGCSRGPTLPQIGEDDIRFELGLAGVLERSRWNLLRLKLRNRGADFQGALEVQALSDQAGAVDSREPIVYRLEAEVPGKSSTFREFAFPVRPEGWSEVLVTFKSPRYLKTFRFPLPPPGRSSRARVLVVGGGSQDLTPLLDPASWDMSEDGADAGDSSLKPQPVALATLSPAELPAIPRAYDPFHVVLLHGASLAEAPQGAIEALTAWVEGGGTLVAFPGPAWASGAPEALWKLLGVSPGDPRAELPQQLLWFLGKSALNAYYRELRPLPETREVDGGLAFVSSPGAGRVVTFSVGPLAEVIRSEDVQQALRVALVRGLSFAGSPAGSLRQVEHDVAAELFKMSGFSIPSCSSVAIGLAVYLALGFFLPALVFKILRRKELTFAAIVVAACLATLGIYRYGLLSAREALELEEVTILRLHHDGKTAEATSYLGFLSPGFKSLDLRPKAQKLAEDGQDSPLARALPQPLRGKFERSARGPLAAAESTIEVSRAQELGLAPVTLYPNGMLYLRYDYKLEVGDLFKIVEETGSDGAISNLTLENLRVGRPMDIFLSWQNSYAFLGAVNPGEALELLPPNRFPAFRTLDAESVQGSVILGKALRAMSAPGRELDEERGPPAVLARGRLNPDQPNYLVAWTHIPLFPVAEHVPVRKAETVIDYE